MPDIVKAQEAGFYRRLGERIRERRRARTLTQEGLATLWNLDRTTVVSIEKGRQRLSIYQLAVLADHLGCSPQDLMPDLHERRELSDTLRDKAGDSRALSFVEDVAAAPQRRP